VKRRLAPGPVLAAVALTAAAVALQWTGQGRLAPPPLAHPGRWAGWLDGRDPAVAAFSLVRLVGLGALWYLVAVTGVGLLLRLVGAARMVRVADRLTVAPVRRLLAGVSLSLAATVAVPATLLPAAFAQPAPTTTTTTTTAAAAPGPPATVTMHLMTPADQMPTAPAPEVTPPPAATATDRWTVRPGECFWTIAESVLSRTWGRAPTDAEIVPYWQRLIVANGAALAHPGNPDLIFPGQVFEIPAP
jgi:hypothetical protein